MIAAAADSRSVSLDLAMLALRAVVGLYLFGHGAQKLFGWFGGSGLSGSVAMVERLGFRPARFWGVNAALGEAGGGLLILLGLLTPLGSIAAGAAMLTAVSSVHWSKGVWAAKGGFELPLTNLAVVCAIALVGPGAYSLDRWLGVSLPEPATLGAVGGVVLIVTLAGLVTRTRPPSGPSRT